MMAGKQLALLGTLADGGKVYDRPNSHLHEGVFELLPRALSQTHPGGRTDFASTHDFGRIIGTTICVETGSDDEIVYAQRRGRKGLTRFVKGRQPATTQELTFVVMYSDDGYWICLTAFIGGAAEPEPWDPRATPQSRPFWDGHALVWPAPPRDVLPSTITSVCPW